MRFAIFMLFFSGFLTPFSARAQSQDDTRGQVMGYVVAFCQSPEPSSFLAIIREVETGAFVPVASADLKLGLLKADASEAVIVVRSPEFPEPIQIVKGASSVTIDGRAFQCEYK